MKPVKAIDGRTGVAAQNFAHHFHERWVAREENKNAPEVVAEWTFVAVGQGFESRQTQVAVSYLVDPAMHEEGVAAN